MFRKKFDLDHDLRPEWTLDTTRVLPAVGVEGVVEATVDLAMDDLGQVIGADEPLPARAGRPGKSRVGTWGPAQRARCTVDPKPGEVCVPGGAFWLGPLEKVLPGGRWHRLAT